MLRPHPFRSGVPTQEARCDHVVAADRPDEPLVDDQEALEECVAEQPACELPAPAANEESDLRSQLWSIASNAFIALPSEESWVVDDARQELRCPNGERLHVYATESERRRRANGHERGKHRIMLRTDMRACNGCPVRTGCTSSVRANMYKQVTRSISEADVKRARALLLALKKYARRDYVRRVHARRAAKPPTRPARADTADVPARRESQAGS